PLMFFCSLSIFSTCFLLIYPFCCFPLTSTEISYQLSLIGLYSITDPIGIVLITFVLIEGSSLTLVGDFCAIPFLESTFLNCPFSGLSVSVLSVLLFKSLF